MIAEAFASLIPSRRAHRNASIENPVYSLNDPALYEVLAAGSRSASGVNVTHQGSLALAAVWQAVSIISGDGSKLPLYPFQRTAEDDREIADKHRSYVAVAIRANRWKSAKLFWADLIAHLLLWRNGYAYIDRTGPRIELYNLLPDRTAPRWVTVPDPRQPGGVRAELIYETEVDGKLETVLPQNILHVRQWSLDGVVAPDLVRAAKDSWGMALAAQNFESKFFKNGCRMGGTLELPLSLSKPAKDTLEEGFRKVYEDGDNPFKVVILRDNAKFHAGQVSPREGQVIELDEKQKREVASYFNLPPSMLGIMDSKSYNSYEQDRLGYLHGCLHHICDSISDQCDMKLLTDQELLNDKIYFEHNYSEFVQADWLSTIQGLEILRRSEFINANEGRRKLNLPRRKDADGETYVNPNTKSAAEARPSDSKPKKTNYAKAHTALFVDAVARAAKRFSHYAREQAKDSGKFLSWSSAGAVKDREEAVAMIRPAVEAHANIFGGEAAAMSGVVESEWTTAAADLLAFTEPPHLAVDLARNVDSYLKQFERTAPERVAAKIMEMSDE